MVITKSFLTKHKTKIIYVLIFIAFIVLAGFSGNEYINIRKDRNALKKDLKEQEKIYKELEGKYYDALDNEYVDQNKQNKFEAGYYRERKLRLQYEKLINTFSDYDNHTADSIVTNYRFN